MAGTLYLIPAPLHPDHPEIIHSEVAHLLSSLKHMVAERAKTCRRFVKAIYPQVNFSQLEVMEFDKHKENDEIILKAIEILKEGYDVGLMSEAGLPCIADPGHELVAAAHKANVRVMPISGPSSIILALISSGFSGQSFCFHGYLSSNKVDLANQLRNLENKSIKDRSTQIFMETPYRNRQVIETALKSLNNSTQLCIAANLTSERQFIKSQKIGQWKNFKIPDLHKQPAIFIIGQ